MKNFKQMKILQGLKIREMAGEHVVILQGRYGADMTRVITLNDSACVLLNELQGKEFELEDAAALLVGRYEIDADTARRDAAAWVEKLRSAGLIQG